MDFEATLATIASYIPEDLDVESALSGIANYIPTEVSFVGMMQFLLVFVAGSLLLSILGRLLLGRRSSLNHSLSSVIGILFVYAVTIVVYTFKPWNLNNFLSPLPFVDFFWEYIVIFSFEVATIPEICHEVLSIIILAFLVNLLDCIIPKGKSILNWYLFRFITVIISMGLHYLFNWASVMFLPGVLVSYAPVILLVILFASLFAGILSLFLGLVLTVTSPVLGGIYTFFFSNLIGKQLSKAIFSSAIICVIVYLIGYFDFYAISISVASLLSYIPLAIVLLLLWYLVGHIL